MRYLGMAAAGLCLLAMSANTGVNPALAAGVSASQAPIVLAQAEPKKPKTITQKVKEETKEVKQKVKKAWRKLTGYKFAVACPVLIPLSHSTCTETGKNRADARAKCQSQNALCSVNDAK